jgi:hypothetical protein
LSSGIKSGDIEYSLNISESDRGFVAVSVDDGDNGYCDAVMTRI